jgi:hypothetical protein
MTRTTCLTVITLVFLFAGFVDSPAQNKASAVSGTVVDGATQKPLPNVNISIVGSTGGGTTNQDGQFSITVGRFPAVLYFSYIGYSISSYQIQKAGEKDIRILLEPEVLPIEEVTIRAEAISKVIKGDTLQIIDYEIGDNRIVLFATPWQNNKDQRLYLANLDGDTLNHMLVTKAGKQIKFPEIIMPQTDYLIRDFTGQIQFLDPYGAHEINFSGDRLSFSFTTPYRDFIGRVLPVKYELDGKLVFQVSTATENYTYFFGRGAPDGIQIKCVRDKSGRDRYASEGLRGYAPRSLDVTKYVSAPLFRKGDELYVFDFFANHIEVFDSELQPVRNIPISFQNTTVKAGLIFRIIYEDVDVRNFTQTILFDEKAGKAYAFFRYRSDNKQYLKEVDLKTGAISRTIGIPDFPNITNLRVYDNVVYFLYTTKTHPYYRLLYRMSI